MDNQQDDRRDESRREEKRFQIVIGSGLEQETREFIIMLGQDPAITEKLVEIIKREKELSWSKGSEFAEDSCRFWLK